MRSSWPIIARNAPALESSKPLPTPLRECASVCMNAQEYTCARFCICVANCVCVCVWRTTERSSCRRSRKEKTPLNTQILFLVSLPDESRHSALKTIIGDNHTNTQLKHAIIKSHATLAYRLFIHVSNHFVLKLHYTIFTQQSTYTALTHTLSLSHHHNVYSPFPGECSVLVEED